MRMERTCWALESDSLSLRADTSYDFFFLKKTKPKTTTTKPQQIKLSKYNFKELIGLIIVGRLF